MPSGNVFIAFCFLIRSVTAFGSAMTMTAALAIVTVLFKANVATVMVSTFLYSCHWLAFCNSVIL